MMKVDKEIPQKTTLHLNQPIPSTLRLYQPLPSCFFALILLASFDNSISGMNFLFAILLKTIQ